MWWPRDMEEGKVSPLGINPDPDPDLDPEPDPGPDPDLILTQNLT